MASRRTPPRPSRDRGLSVVGVIAGGVGVAAALVAASMSGLLPSVAAEPAWGGAWSFRATGADGAMAAAVAERLTLATGLLALVGGLGFLTLLLLLVGTRERRRPGLAVRFALGARRRTLAGYLLARDRRRAALLLASGVVVGVGAALALRWSWPGAGIVGVAAASDAPGAAAAPLVGVVVAVLATALVLALGLAASLAGLAERTPDVLRRGRGVTDDPRAGTVRRGVAWLQVGLSFALAVTGIGLVAGARVAPSAMSSGAGGPEGADGPDPGPAITRYAVEQPAALAEVLATGAARLASPGIWTGVGVTDLVTVECGPCALPVYGVDSTVYAVSAGVLDALGVSLLEGRPLAVSDGADGELVGLVNQRFKRHFAEWNPLGRHVLLAGGEVGRWVRIVGVVDDPPFRGPGAPDVYQPRLYLPLAQHPVAEVEGWLTSSGAVAVPEPGVVPGLRPMAPARSLVEVRAASLAPIHWSGWVLFAAGTTALFLALASAAEVARVEAAGRARAAAMRVALGAPPLRPALAIMRRALSTALLGVGLGVCVAWSLERALGVAGPVGSGLKWGLAAAVVAATLAGALPRARDLLRVQPAVLLREE